MTDPGRTLAPSGRGSDNFDGNHRHEERADLEGQPERSLVVDDYESQTRGDGAVTQASVGGLDPAVVPGATDRRDDLPPAEIG